jgi:hypothetical protein
MLTQLDNLFIELMASNRGPGYAIKFLNATDDLSVINVELRFVTGRVYCCGEPSCHLPSNNGRLLAIAAQHGVPLPEAVIVRWHCYVEQGSRFEVNKAFRLPEENTAYDYFEERTGTQGK